MLISTRWSGFPNLGNGCAAARWGGSKFVTIIRLTKASGLKASIGLFTSQRLALGSDSYTFPSHCYRNVYSSTTTGFQFKDLQIMYCESYYRTELSREHLERRGHIRTRISTKNCSVNHRCSSHFTLSSALLRGTDVRTSLNHGLDQGNVILDSHFLSIKSITKSSSCFFISLTVLFLFVVSFISPSSF